jgi:hypothetical protein
MAHRYIEIDLSGDEYEWLARQAVARRLTVEELARQKILDGYHKLPPPHRRPVK